MRCFNRQFSISTQPMLPLPLPPPGETHLWYVIPNEVKISPLFNHYLDILSPCEKQNVLSFCDDELRKKALLARALVRTTIARYQTNSNVDPRSLEFTKNSYGKPEVDWQHEPDKSWSPLRFNLSHTSSLIACGITTCTPIGIDVEDKKRTTKNNVISFARRFFSPQEVEHLTNILDPEMQRQEFIKLWTLKEAYVKALGRGFSATPFKTFRIHFKAPSEMAKEFEIAVESTHQFSTGQWQFALIELAETHYVAICTENDKLNNEILSPMTLRVWKTIPFVEDMCTSGTCSVVTVGGLVKQLSFK